MEYKTGDKLVVQVTGVDDNEPRYHISNKGDGRWLSSEDFLGKVEDFKPAQEKIEFSGDAARKIYEENGFKGPDSCELYESLVIPSGLIPKLQQKKIKMTVEEKKEFDELKKNYKAPYAALRKISIQSSNYLQLAKRLYTISYDLNNKRQLEFARAWENSKLIEVVHEDVKLVKIAWLHLWKYAGEYKLVADFDERNENYYFTKSEVEKINKLEKFKHVDLVAAWEDGE